MAGRAPPAPKFNPGARSPEQQRRRGGLDIAPKPPPGYRSQAKPAPRQLEQLAAPLPPQRPYSASKGHASAALAVGGAVPADPAAADLVREQLAGYRPCSFYAARVTITSQRAQTVSIFANALTAQKASARSKDIVIGKAYRPRGRDMRAHVFLGFLSPLPLEAARAELLSLCWRLVREKNDEDYTVPEAWRYRTPFFFSRHFSMGRWPTSDNERVEEGDPLSLEIESGPHESTFEGALLDCPLWVQNCGRRFVVPSDGASLEEVARSRQAEALVKLLKGSLGTVYAPDAHGRTALHLAALTGSAELIAALVARAPRAEHSWQDDVGRTPLHYAAFLDAAEPAQALLACVDGRLRDKWGRTAQDLARDLGHYSTELALAEKPLELHLLAQHSVRRLLLGGFDGAQRLLQGVGLSEGRLLAEGLPPHHHAALRRLSALVPGSVPGAALQRSASCMECWYADLLNCKCSPALPGCMELLRLWDDMASFQGLEAEPDADGACVLRAPAQAGAPPLADRGTFLERFHRRTGGILQDMDWSNVMVIGGMVLACLVADDEEYRRHYRQTDVDVYIVGLSGEAFKKRVAEVVSCLPKPPCEGDYSDCVEDARLVSQFRIDRENGWLLVLDECGDPSSWKWEQRPPAPGDAIVGVNGESEPGRMVKALKEAREGRKDAVIRVRPLEALRRRFQPSATLLRTPQTLTSCVRGPSGQPLPNVQVVLAPYSSPAHLLFTTDIDCTAMGFDGQQILATPRAREALRRRRNVVRPEKFSVRGEWRTEARFLKYALRGFRVVDLGLRPGTAIPQNPAVSQAANKASLVMQGQGDSSKLEECIEEIRKAGVYGAALLLHAAKNADLRRLLLHESPKIRAGMDFQSLVGLVGECRRNGTVLGGWENPHRAPADPLDEDEDDGDSGDAWQIPLANGAMSFNDGYGRGSTTLLLVNPSSLKGKRVRDSRLRRKEVGLNSAIAELDLESDRFEVRGWYDGVPERQRQPGLWELDPAVWRGVGDFRSAP